MPADPRWYWDTDGKPAGVLIGDDFFSPRGAHLGHRDGDAVFTLDGRYLADLVDDRMLRRDGRYRRIAATARRARPIPTPPPDKPPLRTERGRPLPGSDTRG
jgi:hypothetical protein